MAKMTLFSDDSDGEDIVEFKINKDYANYYENFRKKETLQRLKDVEGQLKYYESNSDEDSDTELAKPTTRTLEYLADALAVVSSKNTKQATLNSNFLQKKATADDENEGKKKKKKRKEEIYTLETHGRERNKRIEMGQEDVDEEPEPRRPKNRKTIQLLDDSDSDGDDIVALKQDYNTQITGGKSTKADSDLGSRLSACLYKPNMTKDEKWLADFFMSQRENLMDSESEEELSRSRYSARRPPAPAAQHDDGFVYEDDCEATQRTIAETIQRLTGASEVATQQHKSFPAVLESTIRTKDKRRKEQREKNRENREAVKRKLKQEVQQLKAVKRKEIEERLAMIREVSGQTKLAFDEADLDDEFDPDSYDQKMQELYGDQYYGEADHRKPKFDYDENIDGDVANYDDYEVRREELQDHDGDYDEQQDCDGQYEEIVAESSSANATDGATATAAGQPIKRRRRGKKSGQLIEALERKKPLFDPAVHDMDSYYDEYYGMDFEDVIAGVIKCRFKYKTVEPNNFGLSTEEILGSDDKELNRWYSLRKMIKSDRTQEEEERDRKVYRIKAENMVYKKKMLPSFYNPPEEEDHTAADEAAAAEAMEEKRKKKNMKKKLRKQRKAVEEEQYINEEEPCCVEEQVLEEQHEEKRSGETKNKKKRKRNEIEEPIEEVQTVNKNSEEEEEEQHPESKKSKHVTVTNIKDRLTDRKSKKNKSEEVKKKEGASHDSKKKDRSHRKELTVGDAYNTVLKLSDERLLAYNIPALSKLKYTAKYAQKMAGKGVQIDAKPVDKKSFKKFMKKKKNAGLDNDKKSKGLNNYDNKGSNSIEYSGKKNKTNKSN